MSRGGTNLMSSGPVKRDESLAVVPPSRTTARRRDVNLLEPLRPTTAPIRRADLGVSLFVEPLFTVSSSGMDNDLVLLSNEEDTSEGAAAEDFENSSLRIRHDAIEVAEKAQVLDIQPSGCPTDTTSPSKSASSNASSLDQRLPSTPTYSELEPSTRLHSICEMSRAWDIMNQAPQHLSTTNATALDGQGRTPLHVLSMNGSLGSFEDEPMKGFIIDSLWKSHPSAMTIVDNEGYVPFQLVLQEWSQEMLQPNRLSNEGLKPSLMSRSMLWNLIKTPPKPVDFKCSTSQSSPSTPSTAAKPFSKANRQVSSPMQKDLEKGMFSSPMLKKLVSYQQKTKSEHVCATQLTEKVKVALIMVSTILREAGNNSEIGLNVVQHIASKTPLLITAVLLLDRDHEREWALKTRIMHSVLTSKYSIGRWLTDMLQSSNKHVSEAAMDYLRLVSDANLFHWDGMTETSDYTMNRGASKLKIHSKRRFSTGDANPTIKQQKELYSAVSRLSGFVPSLLSLSHLQIEEAATTNLVQQVLNNHISRPFAAMVVLCDAVFLLLVIVGFRAGVNRLLLGHGSGAVMKWIYVANTGIFYFIIRELGKAISLCMITRRARIYFYSFWNLSDVMTTLLSMVSVVSIRGYMATTSFEEGDDVFRWLRFLYAITTGFLWLRVLSFLKAINMQLATFVLAILQITRDVMWFSFILFCLVICFGQMFFTLLVPSACDASSGEGVCTQSEYYLKTYAILLGDFGSFKRADFTSVFSVFLVVIFSFMVVLVLLNVLIAVASDSYEKCLLRSRQLFGRARVMLIAELVSFQNLLKRSRDQTPDEVYKQWWSHYSSWGWSRGSMIFFGLSLLVVVVWIIAETSGIYTNDSSNIWMGLLSIFIIVSLFISIMLFLASGGDKAHDRLDQVLEEWEGGLIKRLVIRILGGSLTGEAFKKQNRTASDEAWQGRLLYLQHEMQRIADGNQLKVLAQMEALETLVMQTEARIQAQIALVKEPDMNACT
ncbi:hypothetical protein MPSEU_000212000 [Mayamaea pseudoterrestris]|nr:hypothetical protein MPSEU_000212000 [Mayamaea pseudoterrestris]